VATVAGLDGGKSVAKHEQFSSGTRPEPQVRRAWEPMSLSRVGTFGDVLKGDTGAMMDGATMKLA
jgi:hypothetical protein